VKLDSGSSERKLMEIQDPSFVPSLVDKKDVMRLKPHDIGICRDFLEQKRTCIRGMSKRGNIQTGAT